MFMCKVKPNHHRGLVSKVSHGTFSMQEGTNSSQSILPFARNCTAISPCQQHTTIIRDAEIAANIVNKCGRTELTGNIDVGENTENALAAKTVTSVKAG